MLLLTGFPSEQRKAHVVIPVWVFFNHEIINGHQDLLVNQVFGNPPEDS